MMRRFLSLLLCLLLLTPLRVDAAVYQDVQYVVDRADLLTDQENIYLNNRAKAASEAWGVDVLIAAVDSLDEETAESYAVSLNGERNWWDTDDAVLFLLALEEREWYIATFGAGMAALSDQELDRLGSGAAEYFSEGNWYGGFSWYLDEIEAVFTVASRQEMPVQMPVYDVRYGQEPEHYPADRSMASILLTSALIGLAVAAVAVLVMRSTMNTKRKQRSAGDYLTPGSYRLYRHQDIFLYSNVSKTRRQQNTGAGGGGHKGSAHRSSGGRSHGGRGGRF